VSLSEAQRQRLTAVDQGIISDCMTRLGIFGWTSGVQPINGLNGNVVGIARTILYGPKRGSDGVKKSTYSIIESLNPGDIFVLAGGGTLNNLTGDNVVNFAERRKLAAVAADSMVRDGEAMKKIPIPVFSRGTSARIGVDMEPMALDVPVVFAGAQIRPGDVLVGSADGFVVLPPSRLDEVFAILDDVEQAETEMQRLIGSGANAAAIEPALKWKKTGKKP
jgi:regulator of RNase E activity RraA